MFGASSFYDSVLRELVAALGAALFFGNVLALMRRRSDAERATTRTVSRRRPGSPVRGMQQPVDGDLAQAPLARTVAYMAIGFIVMVAGIGAMVNK